MLILCQIVFGILPNCLAYQAPGIYPADELKDVEVTMPRNPYQSDGWSGYEFYYDKEASIEEKKKSKENGMMKAFESAEQRQSVDETKSMEKISADGYEPTSVPTTTIAPTASSPASAPTTMIEVAASDKKGGNFVDTSSTISPALQLKSVGSTMRSDEAKSTTLTIAPSPTNIVTQNFPTNSISEENQYKTMKKRGLTDSPPVESSKKQDAGHEDDELNQNSDLIPKERREEMPQPPTGYGDDGSAEENPNSSENEWDSHTIPSQTSDTASRFNETKDVEKKSTSKGFRKESTIENILNDPNPKVVEVTTLSTITSKPLLQNLIETNHNWTGEEHEHRTQPQNLYPTNEDQQNNELGGYEVDSIRNDSHDFQNPSPPPPSPPPITVGTKGTNDYYDGHDGGYVETSVVDLERISDEFGKSAKEHNAIERRNLESDNSKYINVNRKSTKCCSCCEEEKQPVSRNVETTIETANSLHRIVEPPAVKNAGYGKASLNNFENLPSSIGGEAYVAPSEPVAPVTIPRHPFQQYQPQYQYPQSFPPTQASCGCQAPVQQNCCPAPQPCCLPTIPCCPPIPCCPQPKICCQPITICLPPPPPMSCCQISFKVPTIPICGRSCPSCPCRRRVHRSRRLKRHSIGGSCQPCSTAGEPYREKRHAQLSPGCSASSPPTAPSCGTCGASHLRSPRVKRMGCLPCLGRKKREASEFSDHHRVKRMGCLPCLNNGRKKRSPTSCSQCSNLGQLFGRYKRSLTPGCSQCSQRSKRHACSCAPSNFTPLQPRRRQKRDVKMAKKVVKRRIVSDGEVCDSTCCDFSECKNEQQQQEQQQSSQLSTY